MKRAYLPIIVAAAGVGVGATIAAIGESGVALLIAVVGLIIVSRISIRIRNESDSAWLPTLLPIAFSAKMIGAFANYIVTVQEFGGGDATGYHTHAITIAQSLRSLQIPTAEALSLGGRTVEYIAGTLYSLYTPDRLAGFMLFSAISFTGMVLFYVAFRNVASPITLKPYFTFLFFLPTMLFWPSTIGKDAVMSVTIGLATLAVSWISTNRTFPAAPVLAVALVAAAFIRPHVALLVGVSALLAVAASLVIPAPSRVRATRLGVVVALALLAAASYAAILSSIGADTEFADFATQVQSRTQIGGSAVQAQPVLSASDLPAAAYRVLFRPSVLEAATFSQLLSGVESLLIIGLALWTVPRIWRHTRRFLAVPYFAYAAAVVVGYIVMESPVGNLGIVARQRAQILPLLLAVLIGLGWHSLNTRVLSRPGEARNVGAQYGPEAEAEAPLRGYRRT